MFFPVLNHINYRHTHRNNAIPPFRHAKLALELELTVAGGDVCGPNIPMNGQSLVQEFYLGNELSNSSNCQFDSSQFNAVDSACRQ